MHRATLVLVALVVAPAACRTGEPGAETSSSSTTEAEETTGGPTSTTTADDSGAATSSSSSETEEPPASSTTTASPLTSTSEPDLCGNGIQDPGEECDDGNLLDADFCTASCTLAVCGDGIVQLGVEACDDGGGDADDCPGTCQLAKCGDGFVWAGEEQCDDGNFVAGDGCEADCTPTPPVCGDGVAEGEEECDDGNDDENDGCESSCNAYAFWSGVEMDVPEDSLEGWTKCFDTAEDDGQFPQAKLDCLDSPNPMKHFAWVLVGCEHHQMLDGVLEMAAMGVRTEVMKPNQEGDPRTVNGSWWSYLDNFYFGFAPIGIDPHVGFDSPQFDWAGGALGACGPGGLDQPARRVVYVR